MAENDDQLTQLTQAAFLAAARNVIRIHKQAGIPVIVGENGRAVAKSPDEIVLPDQPEKIVPPPVSTA